MISTRRHTYDLNVKLNTVAEAKAVNDNREIAREYGISESWWEKGATGNIFCFPVSCGWQQIVHPSEGPSSDIMLPSTCC